MEKSAAPRNILVIGAPRSGTSLTTAIFSRVGYYVGPMEEEGVRTGDEHNPFGYFEADDVIKQNVGLFQRVGYPEHNTWLEQPISDAQISALSALETSAEDQAFVNSYAARAPWIWKDPRLTLTLGYWWKQMDPDNTGVIFAARDVDDILNSFLRMGWCDDTDASKQEALRRINQHLQAARDTIAACRIPHISINYREYLQSPDAVARKLSEFCRVAISPSDLNVRTDLAHTSIRGRISAWLRREIDRGQLRHLRILRPLVPTFLLEAVFPEKKYTKDRRPS